MTSKEQYRPETTEEDRKASRDLEKTLKALRSNQGANLTKAVAKAKPETVEKYGLDRVIERD